MFSPPPLNKNSLASLNLGGGESKSEVQQVDFFSELWLTVLPSCESGIQCSSTSPTTQVHFPPSVSPGSLSPHCLLDRLTKVWLSFGSHAWCCELCSLNIPLYLGTITVPKTLGPCPLWLPVHFLLPHFTFFPSLLFSFLCSETMGDRVISPFNILHSLIQLFYIAQIREIILCLCFLWLTSFNMISSSCKKLHGFIVSYKLYHIHIFIIPSLDTKVNSTLSYCTKCYNE